MGDRDTRFFHASTIARKRRKNVTELVNEDGEAISDPKLLRKMSVNYFKMLYKEYYHEGKVFPIRNLFRPLSEDAKRSLTEEYSGIEIKEAIFSMGLLKALGLDGLHALFFQSQWSVIGLSVCDFIRTCFHDPAKVAMVNDTFLALILKLENPTSMKNFLPISLCNVIYKAITKVIANRLKNHMSYLIAPT